jgi:hypothetical protein
VSTILFGWMYPDEAMRMDDQTGYSCAFRNRVVPSFNIILGEARRKNRV